MYRRNNLTLTLALLLTLGGALATLAANTPPAPDNKKYHCAAGSWEWVEFAHNGLGTLRRGTSTIKEAGKKADTKRSTLAYDPSRGNFWEYTINPGGPQCQKVTTTNFPNGLVQITFRNCSGTTDQTCFGTR